jgi:hypothetical protein
MKPFRRLVIRPLVVLLLAASPSSVLAQTATQPVKIPGGVPVPAAAPSAGSVSPQAKAEAEHHFKRGLELFDDDDFQGARIEFARAYQLVPNFRVLFNLGQVNFQLQDYVAALHAFEKYLADGGDAVTRERRDEVDRDVAKLRSRVATVTVSATPGAVITLDGALAGTAPLSAPLQVSAGKRVFRALVPSRTPVEKTLDLAGGDSARIELLVEEPKTTVSSVSSEPTPSAPESSKAPWALWGVAGAFAVGTAVTGVLAMNASSSASDIKSSGGSFADYQNTEQRMRTFSITTDIVGAATIVIAGLALYFTVANGSKKTGSTALAPRVAFGRSGGAFSLAF